MLTLGMGALGALLGLLIAWSASPVVATLLPLLFGIVGGASGFTLIKMDLTKDSSEQKLKAIGAALLSCCLACIATLVIGVATKGLFIALQTDSLVYQLSAEQLSHKSTAIESLMLRKRLSAIGATKSEIEKLMSAGPKDAEFKAGSEQISSAVTEFLAAYEGLSQEDQRKLNGISDQNQFARLQGAARIFSMLRSKADASGSMTAAGFRLLTRSLYSVDFGSVIPNDSDSKLFTNQPKLVAAIANLQSVLEQQNTLSDPLAQTKQIDDFLKVFAATKPSADIPLIANSGRRDELM